MGKGSRLRRKKRREIEKEEFKNRKTHHESSFDLYGSNTFDNGLPDNINFRVRQT